MEQPSTTIGCFQAGGTQLQYPIIAPSDCFQPATVNIFAPVFTIVTPSMAIVHNTQLEDCTVLEEEDTDR